MLFISGIFFFSLASPTEHTFGLQHTIRGRYHQLLHHIPGTSFVAMRWAGDKIPSRRDPTWNVQWGFWRRSDFLTERYLWKETVLFLIFSQAFIEIMRAHSIKVSACDQNASLVPTCQVNKTQTPEVSIKMPSLSRAHLSCQLMSFYFPSHQLGITIWLTTGTESLRCTKWPATHTTYSIHLLTPYNPRWSVLTHP